ncbi:MAG: EAL domain-containing protein [Rhodococcus sp. (in: high G+C Gram-positive bacteria)]
MPEDVSTDVAPPLHVIAVGASAGGLTALTALLGATKVEFDWCFVVAQHMSPSSGSELWSLLDRATELTVVEATSGDRWRPNTVFVAPPGRDITVHDGAIVVDEPDADHRPWPSIDRLFISAALEFGERAVAVVLSGTGDDGAAGVEAIESAGGVVAVQKLGTAAFDGMPAASFATGAVDIQAQAADISDELERFLRTYASVRLQPGLVDAPASEEIGDLPYLGDAIAVLREMTGIDFQGYKRSTLFRQMSRRQRLAEIDDVNQYVSFLRSNQDEADAFARALLVTVTAFFRDSGVWEFLRHHLAAVIAASDGEQIRIWVPGCASGEEAYTVAMLAADALGRSYDDLASRLKIFATDLNDHALEVARHGRYSTEEARSIPDESRQLWTRPAGDGIEIVPSLRECIVFARHNVAFDPPFPNLDLISLRNTLIYFQPRLQERVLQLCQFALVPNGLLLLGQSERVPRAGDMFAVVDNDHRLYRRHPHSRPMGLPLGPAVRTPRTAGRPDPHDSRTRTSSDGRFYRDVVRAVTPAALLIDSNSALVEVIGDVSQWCSVGEGAHSGHVVDLLKEEYRASVRAMLSQLRHSVPNSATRRISTELGTTRIAVARIDSDTGDTTSRGVAGAIVMFESGPDPAGLPSLRHEVDDGSAAEVSVELESVYEALQATVEDLSTSNEELQALNEELQASAEELQASTEEVQASNEELEATNEELTTLNQELSARGSELMRANTDLENIQSSLTSGLVLVDRQLRVTRFSALAVRLFSLIPSDVGRRLSAVPTTMPVLHLDELLEQTLAGESTMSELASENRDLLIQTQPYRGDKNEILGVIVMVIDVSETSAQRRITEQALMNLEMLTDSIPSVAWQRDSASHLTLLTRSVESVFGLDRDRVLADPGLLLSAVHSDDRDRVASVSATTDANWQLRYRVDKADGTLAWVEEEARLVQPADGSRPVRVGTVTDVTREHELETNSKYQAALLGALFGSQSLGIVLVDRRGRIVSAGSAIESMSGFDQTALTGRTLSSLIVGFSANGTEDASNLRMECAEGNSIPVALEYLSVDKAASDDLDVTILVVHDSSRLRRLSAELAAHEQFDQQTGLLTRTHFRNSAQSLVAAANNRAAVLWIDLDGFKQVNDRLGHRSGDLVLAVVASRLQRAVRQNHLVGRLGGDEFAVLISRVDDLDALDGLVHRILTAIREPVVIDESVAFVSASIGVAVQPDDGSTADELMHNADVAMYAAKSSGRDQHVYFTSEMDRDADNKAAMRHQLAAAVRQHDFELHYQPIRKVTSGEIVMVEALIRWRRDGELVDASQFIDLAAETGQLRAVGNIVLDCLIEDVDTLFERVGPDHPRVSVNMSATELGERDVTDRLLSWQPPCGFDKIVIEVTEQTTVVPGNRAFEILALLRRLGATIGIDDFGTGYSNLELLGQLQPGIIKIDRSLVEGAATDERGSRILDAAVGLAHALEATVVVEGVSSAELEDVGVRTGADLAQGFYLGKPQPLASIIELLGRT